jgi:hypothetical protein
MTDLVVQKEIKDISLQTNNLIDKSNTFLQIFSRAGDPNANSLIEFKTFDETKLAKIAERMPEINRATNVFGRQNSQATSKLMSLNMISQSPYRRLKQCLAQIERKRQALKENIFKLRKEKIELEKLIEKKNNLTEKLAQEGITNDEHMNIEWDLQITIIEIEEKVANISDSNIYVEGALKEIGMYQDAYNEIKTSYNIPENWDESNYEQGEVEEHVKTAFLHTIRDVEMTGRLNVGTHEYLEQYGINPHTAYKLVCEYLAQIEQLTQEGNYTNITVLYNFLDKMYDTFKDEYRHAMRRSGLVNLISTDYLFIDKSNISEIEENYENKI